MTGAHAEVIRAADEGVPIGALKRIFRPYEPRDLRDLLHKAVSDGRIVAMPREDWPAITPRDSRVPTVPNHTISEDDPEIVLKMARYLKTTKLESRILLVVLRRGHASREQLHDAVEDNRGNPDEATDKKIVDVVVCKLRKKLTKIGVILHTIHSIGYEMNETDRAKLWSILRGVN